MIDAVLISWSFGRGFYLIATCTLGAYVITVSVGNSCSRFFWRRLRKTGRKRIPTERSFLVFLVLCRRLKSLLENIFIQKGDVSFNV